MWLAVPLTDWTSRYQKRTCTPICPAAPIWDAYKLNSPAIAQNIRPFLHSRFKSS